MKSNQKNINKSLIFLFLTVIIFLLSSCSKKKSYEWTIVVYMAADNSLSSYAASDINQLEAANFDEDNIKVIVISDLLNLPNNERPVEDSRVYEIHHDDDMNKVTSKIVRTYTGEFDSGDYHLLSDYGKWAYNKYPSTHRALFISSHGNSWYPYFDKFCIDHSSLNFFNIPNGDLKKALRNLDKKIDILGLDACNMQSLEVLNEVKSYADYVISSEYEIQASGFPYTDIMNSWGDFTDKKALANNIGMLGFNSFQAGGSQNPYGDNFLETMSTVDMEFFKDVTDLLSDFLDMDLETIKNEVVNARNQCSNYFDMDYASQIDIMQFFKFLRAEFNTQNQYTDILDILIDKLEILFSYHQSYLFPENTGYGTIWFPTKENTYENMKDDYSKLRFYKTGWTKIIDIYFSSDVDKNRVKISFKNY